MVTFHVYTLICIKSYVSLDGMYLGNCTEKVGMFDISFEM
jgi:hypothetical protein